MPGAPHGRQQQKAVESHGDQQPAAAVCGLKHQKHQQALEKQQGTRQKGCPPDHWQQGKKGPDTAANGTADAQKQPPAQINDGISPPFSHLEASAQGQKRGKANQEKSHRHDSRQHDGCRVGKIQQVHHQVQQQEPRPKHGKQIQVQWDLVLGIEGDLLLAAAVTRGAAQKDQIGSKGKDAHRQQNGRQYPGTVNQTEQAVLTEIGVPGGQGIHHAGNKPNAVDLLSDDPGHIAAVGRLLHRGSGIRFHVRIRKQGKLQIGILQLQAVIRKQLCCHDLLHGPEQIAVIGQIPSGLRVVPGEAQVARFQIAVIAARLRDAVFHLVLQGIQVTQELVVAGIGVVIAAHARLVDTELPGGQDAGAGQHQQKRQDDAQKDTAHLGRKGMGKRTVHVRPSFSIL